MRRRHIGQTKLEGLVRHGVFSLPTHQARCQSGQDHQCSGSNSHAFKALVDKRILAGGWRYDVLVTVREAPQ